jgi:hypothetical protein
VLRALLAAEPPADVEALRARVGHAAAAEQPGAVEAVVAELHREGFIAEPPAWLESGPPPTTR